MDGAGRDDAIREIVDREKGDIGVIKCEDIQILIMILIFL